MEQKNKEISVNTSSGAEKVEKIEREQKTTQQGTTRTVRKRTQTKSKTARGDAAMGDSKAAESVKKANARSTDGRAEQESQAAKARVEAALRRKEAQAKKKAERKAKREQRMAALKKKIADKKAAFAKRAAEKKARAEKRAAERKALAEKRKAEKEEKLRQRAKAKAERNNDNYKKKKQRNKTKSERREKRKQRRENGERNRGYGGWIAAVVSLGVVTLALGTTVTVGAVEMSKNKSAMLGGHRSTMYELTGIMENVEGDLDRVRVSNSSVQQARILTDLLVQTRLAELDLEKLPVAAETDRNLTSFVNHTARECERMLGKLRHGEQLSENDQATLQRLYEKNHALRSEFNSLVSNMTDKDLTSYLKKGAGNIKDALERIEKSTIEENMPRIGENMPKMKGAGMERAENLPAERPEGKHIEAASAEQLCAQYFSDYTISKFQCIGETTTRGYSAYNVQGYDDKGNQLFAEVSQADGTLLRFDYYEDCMGDTFELDHAEDIAEEFLEKLGYEDMEVVRLRKNGSNIDFTFAYEDDDVVYYPDEIRVKVCRTRGLVSGFDATKYLRNHKERGPVKTSLSLADAYGKLRKGLDVESSRLTVVKTMRGERAAYEFLCGYQEERYFVFVDAMTGEEISIVNVKSVS